MHTCVRFKYDLTPRTYIKSFAGLTEHNEKDTDCLHALGHPLLLLHSPAAAK